MAVSKKSTIITVLAICFILGSAMPVILPKIHTWWMLKRPYEQNADELMTLIKQKRFKEVETFIRYVDRKNIVTRDGFRYFRAILERWFFASEVLEFNRPQPVPQDLLPLLNQWIYDYPESEIPYIIRGVYHIERGWEIRSRRYSSEVNKKNMEAFHNLHLLAKDDLEKAYRINPLNPHSSRQLIRVQRALNSKDSEAADRYFNHAIRNHPTFYWAYRAKLENMMPKWGGDWKSMFHFAVGTVKNAPSKTLLPHILAYALEEAAARSPNKTKFLSQPKVWNSIERVYTQIIADYPESTFWKVCFARVAMNAGKDKLALKYLDLAENEDPHYYRMIELKMLYAEGHHNWTTEEKYACALVAACPQYDRAYAGLGYAFLNMGKYKKAIDNYTRAIALTPGSFRWIGSRCFCYVQTHKYAEAINDCTKAIEINKEYAYAYKERAEAYEKSGDAKASMADRITYKTLMRNGE